MESFQNKHINIHTHHPKGKGVEIVNLFPDGLVSGQLPELCSVGIHPWHIRDNWEQQFQKVEAAARDHRVYAIGETGLDKLTDSSMDLQIEVFKKHIELSERYQKPLIIHCVKAFNELIELKKNIHPTASWIVHGFDKNLQVADMLIRHEIYMSFGKALLKPDSNARKVLPEIPDEVYLLETDDMEISIEEVYREAAGLVDLDEQKMKDLMFLNFINCFRI